MRTLALAVICSLALAGCHTGSAPAVAVSPGPSASPSPSVPPATGVTAGTPGPTGEPTGAPTGASKPASATPVSAPQPAPALPDSLKNAAYEYYGLGNGKPMDYEFVGPPSQGIMTGSITTTLKDVKDGAAYFDQVSSGGLAKLGSNELSLDGKGVHVVKSSMEAVEPGNIEFPADVTPGYSWTSHEKTTDPALSADITTKYTIKGQTSVKTKRGTLQALEITSTGEGTNNGEKMRMESESYYVKGVGLVKAVITTKMADGKSVTMTQQLAD